jgi:outer membrane protein OmpA-like peptidoglycan-associated protein
MNSARQIALLIAAGAVVLTSACARAPVRTPEPGPDPKTATLVVLLPDRESAETGRAVVSNAGASAELDAARESTLVAINRAPSGVTVMSEAEVARLFGDLLSALPPPPQHFTLLFRFQSDELTDESRALVPDVLRAVRGRPVPEVVVVGHTDTTGSPASNFDLGLKRATMVRALLVEAGLDPASVEVASHGEAELLVQTGDDTYEPRNRRVEITIR